MLFGCIYVPDFPVQAALLCEAKIYLAEGIASQKTLPDKSAGKGSSLKTFSNEISPSMASLGQGFFGQSVFH